MPFAHLVTPAPPPPPPPPPLCTPMPETTPSPAAPFTFVQPCRIACVVFLAVLKKKQICIRGQKSGKSGRLAHFLFYFHRDFMKVHKCEQTMNKRDIWFEKHQLKPSIQSYVLKGNNFYCISPLQIHHSHCGEAHQKLMKFECYEFCFMSVHTAWAIGSCSCVPTTWELPNS